LEHSRCALTVDVESDIDEVKFNDIDEIHYLLNLFESLQISCTFFFTGRFIEKRPDIVDSVAERGHEVALHGYAHESWKMSRCNTEAKIKDLKKLDELMFSLSIRPLGFRAPFLSIDYQVLKHLREIGFAYDSSIFQNSIPKPIRLLTPHIYDQLIETTNPFLVEFPISTVPLFKIPCSLNWLLMAGPSMYKILTKAYSGKMLVFYMHPYDVLPRTQRFGIPFRARFFGQKDSKKALNSFIQYLLKRDYAFVRLMDELPEHV
jgi:peptidoglycan/xylan/chitin deacetylase (PgdA/CDA1 family)